MDKVVNSSLILSVLPGSPGELGGGYLELVLRPGAGLELVWRLAPAQLQQKGEWQEKKHPDGSNLIES